MNYLIDVNPPTRFSSLETVGGYRGSWGASDAYLNDEHSRIHAETESLPGPPHLHDTEKLYEMAFHSGAVILEIGTNEGRSATVALRVRLRA